MTYVHIRMRSSLLIQSDSKDKEVSLEKNKDLHFIE